MHFKGTQPAGKSLRREGEGGGGQTGEMGTPELYWILMERTPNSQPRSLLRIGIGKSWVKSLITRYDESKESLWVGLHGLMITQRSPHNQRFIWWYGCDRRDTAPSTRCCCHWSACVANWYHARDRMSASPPYALDSLCKNSESRTHRTVDFPVPPFIAALAIPSYRAGPTYYYTITSRRTYITLWIVHLVWRLSINPMPEIW